jgi:hypothetical protein
MSTLAHPALAGGDPTGDAVKRLAAPFSARHLKFRPGATHGNRALALPYVDARAIQDRLDEVLGVGGWQDEYEPLEGGSVLCRLRVRLGDEWVCKADVGSPSEQPDEGDRVKAAFSDALKRAAVKFGVGRYLYSLPAVWEDYDPRSKRFVRPPRLPAAAGPGPLVQSPQGPPPRTAPDRAALDRRDARARRVRPLMERLGYEWADVCRYVNRAPGTGLSELTDAEFEAACAAMEGQLAQGAPAPAG